MTVIAYLIPQGKIDQNLISIGFMFSDVNIISIVGAVIAGVYICGDFENKTIQDAVANGISRGTVIVSKAIVFSLGVFFILLPYVIITIFALSSGAAFSMGALAVGLLNILTTEAGVTLTAFGTMKLVGIMFLIVLVYTAQLSICIPLALMLKKPVLVVPIYYGLSILFAQLSKALASSTVMDRLFSITPFGGKHMFLTLQAGAGDILKTLFVSLFFILFMIVLAYSGFRRAEIK